MAEALSRNTQAILMLTAPMIAGRSGPARDPLLTPGEYKRLARRLRALERTPADFLAADAAGLIAECGSEVEPARLQRLLGRGFLLSQALERWQTRAIWVVSRADAGYPRRLKTRLREGAPPILYGCGDPGLLGRGGLAVVGSRKVDDALIEFTASVGALAARAGRPIVSGGARGVDQAAMGGSLQAGGLACGVLADKLERACMNRENRNLILEGRLTLASPFDPAVSFNVGHAMQRNKLIYALADAALIANSDYEKGGTWAGATEQLTKWRFVPVYVRATGKRSKGLDALREMGATPWPNPNDAEAFNAVFNAAPAASPQASLPFGPSEETTRQIT